MTRGTVARLRAEIRADRDAWTARLAELRELDLEVEADAALDAQAAVALHHAYGAVESAIARLTRFLEGSLPEGGDWHQSLLEATLLDLEGVRPALLSRDTVSDLRKLLAFRHFFRHAYAVQLDTERLRELQAVALGVEPRLADDFEGIDEILRALEVEADA